MHCPVCHEPLLVLEHEGVEIDFCHECHGIWLDAGELELLLGGFTPCEAFIASGERLGGVGEKTRRCPICRAKMHKVKAGAVVYDRCPSGHGLWLDRGELEQLMAESPAAAQVPEFLAAVFGGPERP